MTQSRCSVVRGAGRAVIALGLAWCVPLAGAAQQDTAVRDAVARALSGERDFANVDVSLDADGRVLLFGDVRVLWTKMRAVARALEAAGGQAIASDIRVSRAESDQELADAVVLALRDYEQLTVFDYVSGSVASGVVTLVGKVTPVPDKVAGLTERVARVPGVQDLRNKVEITGPSQSDDELRFRLAQSIFGHPSFRQFAGIPNPPFHVVVDNGIVTLIGYVRSQVEMLELQGIVSSLPGILRIENQLEALQ